MVQCQALIHINHLGFKGVGCINKPHRSIVVIEGGVGRREKDWTGIFIRIQTQCSRGRGEGPLKQFKCDDIQIRGSGRRPKSPCRFVHNESLQESATVIIKLIAGSIYDKPERDRRSLEISTRGHLEISHQFNLSLEEIELPGSTGPF